jgi:hypothetical protein
MSKSQKKKVSVKLMPGEAIYVSSLETLLHIMETYNYMGSQSSSKEEADWWYSVSREIKEWAEKTFYSEGNLNEEEW